MGDVEQRCNSCGALLNISTDPWIQCTVCSRYNNVPLRNRQLALKKTISRMR